MTTHRSSFTVAPLARAIRLSLFAGFGLSTAAHAQEDFELRNSGHNEDKLETIVVSAPFRESEAQTALPVVILSGEALKEKVTNSLGDTLKNEIGVNNASFGTGVGQPIIRGQTGNRVSVLQNGLPLTDASAVSPDHANGTEPLLADRLEVVRGPATLLYGSGAVGGVVNVIDNRIPEQLPGETQFLIEQNYNSVNDEDKTVMRLDAALGNFGIHLDAYTRENDNVEIPGFAINEEAVEILEERAVALGLQEEHDEEEEEEFTNTNGFIGNSDGEAQGGTAGLSYVTDNGFVGFAFSTMDNDYGLPPGTHSHSHGHDEEHGDEEHGDEGHGDEEHGEEEVEFVRLELEQERYDFRGGYEFDGGWVESIEASVAYTDYQHSEIEFFEDGGVEVGTTYDNEGVESRFTLNRATTGRWSGVYGLQISDFEFSAIGEEAYIAPSDVNNIGLFGIERFTEGAFTAELGLRVENADIDPGGSCGYDETVASVSASGLYSLNDTSNLMVAVASSERAPSVEELFSNIDTSTCATFADEDDLTLHAATGLLELGNANLDTEQSNNIEFGYRMYGDNISGSVSAYYNDISDYIYLDLTGELIEEQTVARYFQQDARFTGFEAELTVSFPSTGSFNTDLTFFGDMVDARLDGGGRVPRIPASKIGSELRMYSDNWSAHLHLTRMNSQDETALLELETPGYTLLSLYADYHLPMGDSELKLFIRGDNLLDEEVRNHASFLRNFAPEPGRGYVLGLRYEL